MRPGLAVTAVFTCLTLAACGSATKPALPSDSRSPSASTSLDAPTTSPTNGTLPPVMVDPTSVSTITVNIDQSVVFTVSEPEKWKGYVANPAIAEFVPGGDQGTWTANPGLKLLLPGTTTISLTLDGDMAFVIDLTVNDNTLGDMEKTRTETQLVANDVIGMTEKEAVDYIAHARGKNGEKFTSRIGRRDAENYPLTMDYRTDRITLEFDNDKVTRASVG